MKTLLILVPGAPFLAAFCTLLFGHRLPKKGAWLPVLGITLSLIAVLWLPTGGITAEISWLSLPDITLTVGLRVDALARFVSVLVAVIALIVNLYAAEYMKIEGDDRRRFYTWMSFFAAAMLALVLANSLALFFAAWEMVGLASWGLIGFCYAEERASRSAQMAFLMTRLGDFGMLLGWLLVMTLLGNVNIDVFLAAVRAGKFEPHVLTLLAVLFFAAAVGKSAQLPLTAWLPEAMVGPTPVSALLHSATMVAAGVYLVLRFFPLFASAAGALVVVLWTGAVTAIFAAIIATSQADLKRILAWSTVSQLGEMMMALGFAAPSAALYHLSTHAVFKSGLFLAAGAIERATGAKNLQEMGGLRRLLPILGISFGVDALALAGFPLLSGFWSEERILAAATQSGVLWTVYICLLVFLAGVYISRAAAGIFLNWPGSSMPATQKTGKLVLTTTAVLAVGSVVAGFLLWHPIEYFSLAGANVGEPGWTWRLSAIAASLLGLAFGTWRVVAVGPQPSFAPWPAVLGRVLYRSSVAPAKAALAVSGRMWTEQMLDVFARTTARFADTAAFHVQKWPEQALDFAATITASSVNAAGLSVQNLEDGGFVAETNRLSSAIGALGEWLRGFETGKIYTYTRTVFVWAILVACVVVLVWR